MELLKSIEDISRASWKDVIQLLVDLDRQLETLVRNYPKDTMKCLEEHEAKRKLYINILYSIASAHGKDRFPKSFIDKSVDIINEPHDL